MTDAEVIAELRSDSTLNKARAVFSSWSARIDQETRQGRSISPIEMRRMEFEAVRKIQEAFNATL